MSVAWWIVFSVAVLLAVALAIAALRGDAPDYTMWGGDKEERRW